MTTPDWARNPVLAALLNTLLDRIEVHPFVYRQRSLVLPLTAKTWPAFFKIDLPGERTFHWQLFERLLMLPGFTLKLDERRIARDLDLMERRPKLVVGPEAEFFLRDATDRLHSNREIWIARWRQAVVQRFSQHPPLAQHLMSRPIVVLSRSPDEVIERFIGLSDLADDGLMLHEAASRQFWGLSKLLNNHQEAIALLAEAPECPFPNRPVQLVVQALTGALDAPILFVENGATFESLSAGRMPAADGHILIYASGYKASARRIRSAMGSSLYFSERVFDRNPKLPETIRNWLYSLDSTRQVYFWGDLDYAGMAILKELRVLFPNAIAWRPGYSKLLEHLSSDESHSPEEAAKTGQSDPGETGCDYADTVLLPAIRERSRFVDQESI
jgi:hypothetical protein